MECPACHTPNADGARFCAKCGALLPANATPEADPLIGTIVGGRFRIMGVLGEGGMGRVYNGEQQMGTSVRKVAIKTLLSQYAKDTQVVARFMRECGTVSELEHPNTIKVYDFGQTPSGELYIAMELLSGVSLEKALETGPLSPERCEKIVTQICGSLQEAHDKGIVHRDLKPANIYLTTRAGEDDCVKVLDFGIAKRDDKHSKHEQKLTQQGTVLGTPPYMSPEQFKGHELDLRSDIYSLGVMTYEMLTGRLPFDADTPWAWATQHMTAQPFPFETIPLGSQVPPKMKAAVMRALSKDKERRQQSAREYCDEFAMGYRTSGSGFGGGTAVLGRPSGPGPYSPYAGDPSSNPGPTAPDTQQPSGQMMAPPAVYAQQPSVPTGSGQVFPTPAQVPVRKGGGGVLVAVLAIVGVSVIVGSIVLFRKPAGTDAGAATGSTAQQTAPPPPAVTSVSQDPSPPPTATTNPDSTTRPPNSAEPKANDDCQKSMAFAQKGEVVRAVEHYEKCTDGSERPRIKNAISVAAMNAAHEGCTGLAAAKAAHSIQITRPLEMLQPKHCKPTGNALPSHGGI